VFVIVIHNGNPGKIQKVPKLTKKIDVSYQNNTDFDDHLKEFHIIGDIFVPFFDLFQSVTKLRVMNFPTIIDEIVKMSEKIVELEKEVKTLKKSNTGKTKILVLIFKIYKIRSKTCAKLSINTIKS
jgi:hypothetical protein